MSKQVLKLKSVVLCLNDRFLTTRQILEHLVVFKFTVIWEDDYFVKHATY